MKIVYLSHALTSCWNHGNAHFQRGVLAELARRGHDVVALEPVEGWSKENLRRDHGEGPEQAFARAYPEITVATYGTGEGLAESVADADLVIVHEWTDPAVVAALGRARRSGGRFTLLFHDTHHRAVSDPEAIRAFDLDGYDGVLAFGATLAEVYRRWGWDERVFVWHEAADTLRFRPPLFDGRRNGVVFVGNWGDGERTAEFERFLFRPVERAGLPLTIHGVRYPPEALERIAAAGGTYRGWIANLDVPAVFARHLATVHVPRRFYVEMLPGIPTIRVFEALACGIPLVCAPWDDAEGLFTPGEDYLVAPDEDAMIKHLADLRDDADLRAGLAERGLRTIRARHSCATRADELLSIVHRLAEPRLMETVP